MKLWIDDLRPVPDWFKDGSDEVVWAKTSVEAIQAIDAHRLTLTHISFDHDLGGDDKAIVVANHLEQLAHDGDIGEIVWTVHSRNPVGRDDIIRALRSCDRFWSKREGN